MMMVAMTVSSMTVAAMTVSSMAVAAMTVAAVAVSTVTVAAVSVASMTAVVLGHGEDHSQSHKEEDLYKTRQETIRRGKCL